jgi:lipoprotein-releasing system permease protein
MARKSTNFLIALRFLLSRKRAMLMSLAGIVFGVTFFIVTQAQTSGFEQFFIRTMLGVNGALRVEDRIQQTMRSMEAERGTGFAISMDDSVEYIEGVEHPDELESAVGRFREVVSVAQVLRGSAEIKGNFREMFCKPYGINLEQFLGVSDLDQQILYGDLDRFRNNPQGLLVGVKLAQRLQLEVGDPVLLEAAGSNERFRVSGIYETGIEQVDKERVFLHMPAARTLLKKPFGVSYLQVNLLDHERAPEVAERIERVVMHGSMSWQEREKTWLQVFRALRVSSAITVSSIILISGLGMFNTLVMIVMEKTKEIAILRSMGYQQRDIRRIFLWQGFTVLSLGVALGCILAAVATYAISRLPIRIRGIFSTDSFVVHWSWTHYVAAALIATVIVMVASYFPARRAARLEPGDIIRGTSG